MFTSWLRPLISGSLLGLMLAFPQCSLQAALQGLTFFSRSVLPSLFPFTACMLLFTAGRTFSPGTLLFFSLLGGSPTGARLFSEASPAPALARAAAGITGVMSPMFFLGTLSVWLGSVPCARLLLFCHLLSVLCFLPSFRRAASHSKVRLPPLSVGGALQQSALAMLNVGGCITLGSVGAQLLSRLVPTLSPLPLALLQSIIEVTSGCKSLVAAKPPLLLPSLAAATAFSGLSILLQNAAFWGKCNISLQTLLKYALFRATIAFLLCFSILLCHPGVFAV